MAKAYQTGLVKSPLRAGNAGFTSAYQCKGGHMLAAGTLPVEFEACPVQFHWNRLLFLCSDVHDNGFRGDNKSWTDGASCTTWL
jgi:hypothetical protein